MKTWQITTVSLCTAVGLALVLGYSMGWVQARVPIDEPLTYTGRLLGERAELREVQLALYGADPTLDPEGEPLCWGSVDAEDVDVTGYFQVVLGSCDNAQLQEVEALWSQLSVTHLREGEEQTEVLQTGRVGAVPYALEADQATFAHKAQEAQQAEMATLAEEAQHAQTAVQAENAVQADNAREAEHALSADTALSANSAASATSAMRADASLTSEEARHAQEADMAERAEIATLAEEAMHAQEADRAAMADLAALAQGAEGDFVVPGAFRVGPSTIPEVPGEGNAFFAGNLTVGSDQAIPNPNYGNGQFSSDLVVGQDVTVGRELAAQNVTVNGMLQSGLHYIVRNASIDGAPILGTRIEREELLCPVGESVLSGGCSTGDSDIRMISSRPAFNDQNQQGWSCRVANGGGGTDIDIWALCGRITVARP